MTFQSIVNVMAGVFAVLTLGDLVLGRYESAVHSGAITVIYLLGALRLVDPKRALLLACAMSAAVSACRCIALGAYAFAAFEAIWAILLALWAQHRSNNSTPAADEQKPS